MDISRLEVLDYDVARSGLIALGGPARHLRRAPSGESSQNIPQLVQRLGQGRLIRFELNMQGRPERSTRLSNPLYRCSPSLLKVNG